MDNFDKMTKNELLEFAEKNEIIVKDNLKKDDIIVILRTDVKDVEKILEDFIVKVFTDFPISLTMVKGKLVSFDYDNVIGKRVATIDPDQVGYFEKASGYRVSYEAI